MKRILLPTDFSENSERAIFYCLSLFGNNDTKFILLNSYFIPYTSDDVLLSISDETEQNAHDSFELLLDKISIKYPGRNFDFETIFVFGSVWDAVSDIRHKKKIDLIAMGTKGANGLTELLIGSNTAAVVSKVHCPVLVIPEKSLPAELKRIVLTVDLKERTDINTLSPLIEIAKNNQAEILLLHVLKDESSESENENLRILKSLMKEHHFEYYTILDEKVPHGIGEFVNNHPVDMLAMIAHKYNLFGRIFHKSITKKMTMHTDIPLLVLHDQNK